MAESTFSCSSEEFDSWSSGTLVEGRTYTVNVTARPVKLLALAHGTM
jgi:hypothetical protein